MCVVGILATDSCPGLLEGFSEWRKMGGFREGTVSFSFTHFKADGQLDLLAQNLRVRVMH